MGPERIEGFKHQPEGLLRFLGNVDFEHGHGAARHHHVRAEGPALGGKKLPALAESVEHIAHDGGVELLPQQLKQLGVIFPFHASSVMTRYQHARRPLGTCHPAANLPSVLQGITAYRNSFACQATTANGRTQFDAMTASLKLRNAAQDRFYIRFTQSRSTQGARSPSRGLLPPAIIILLVA